MLLRPALLASSLLALSALSGCGDDAPADEPNAPALDATEADGSVADTSEPDAGTTDAGDTADTTADIAVEVDAELEPDTELEDATDVSPEPEPPLEVQLEGWTPPGDLSLPPALVPEDGEFYVVIIPDSQIYSQRFPETLDGQMRWIAEHAEPYNIVFVSHVGDVVQTASELNEWEVARAAYDWIDDADIPHGFSIGGHDTSPGTGDFDNSCSPFPRTDCASTNFMANFGPQRVDDRSWFAGASPSGRSTAQRIEVDGLPLLFLHLPQDTPTAEVEWAGEVLDANPDALAHLTTHRYLFDYRLTDYLPSPLPLLKAGRFSPLTYTLGGQSLMYLDGLEADVLFARLIRNRPNLWGVHCGHVDAEFWQQSTNAAGLPVTEILVDFQDMADGGGGWLRLLRFRPADNKIDVVTFSTLTGEIRRDGDGFEHSIEILDYYRTAYGGDLEQFGLTEADTEALLAQVLEEGPYREGYRASLYDGGQRDSLFTIDVDFSAYLEAAQ